MRRIKGKLTDADRSGALVLLAHDPKVGGSNPPRNQHYLHGRHRLATPDLPNVQEAYHPHFGQTSTLVPLVFVIWTALVEPSALIKKSSLLTRVEPQGEMRRVEDVYAEKPIAVPSDHHIALSRPEAALPLFFFVVTRITAPMSKASE